ncbi:MAG: hypothetical protein H6712_20025 [Myxococcales bacterium]|nr:hypothetical protein [Myxococcales bacterium]MCB9716165.1 hypothetical protein [Myxococcales bacterium]
MDDGVARFRWGIAALHAVAAIGVVLVVTVVMAIAMEVADPERFGQGAGRLALFFAFGAFGASWLAQMQWKRAAIAVRLVLVALLLGTVILVVALDARAGTPPTAAVERP